MLCVIATSTYYIHTTVNYKTTAKTTSLLDNAPSWVRYPKEKLYTEPPLRMFACVKKKPTDMMKKNMLSFLCVYFCDEFKKQLLSHIIYLFFVSAIFRMRNKNISIIVVTKTFLFLFYMI